MAVGGGPATADPDVLMAMPEVPPVAGPSTMSATAIAAAMKERLPAWAQAAEVSVEDDAAGERVVVVTMSLPWRALAWLDVREVSGAGDAVQAELAERGARIGRVIVRISDSQSHDPIYASGDDMLLGRLSYWVSPLAEGFASLSGAALSESPTAPVEGAPDHARDAVGNDAVPPA